MNSKNNDNSLFNKLPASILSTIFVLVQNPQLSLLNENMHYASQQVDTISKYILLYALSDTKDNLESNLSTIFEKYTRININETAGALVLRKIKSLDYETALNMAFKYKWRNVLKKLLKMYVVIDRNTSTVVYKGTIFMNEGEYLDVDIGSLFLENSESEKDLIDIKISHSLYFRPLVASRLGMKVLFKKLRTTLQTMAVEALIYVYDAKIKLPLGVSVSVEKNIKFTASKAILYSILVAARRSCELDIIELLKRVLEFNIKVTLSIQELRAFNNVYNMYTFGRSIAFIKKYGYETNMELLIYMACLCYSICWDREEQVKLLEDNYPDAICQQMLFDAAIFHEKTSLVKEYFFKVELNSENIRKITEMAYDRGYIDMIKFLLNHSDKLKGDLDENAIMIAIEHSDYELTKEIINKYPNIVSASCLAEAVESGDIRIAKLLINSGINLKSPEFNGITIANRNNDINMLQLLLENGASDGSLD